MIAFPLKAFLATPMVVLKVLLNAAPDYSSLIEQIVKLAETARRDGLLALESQLGEVEDPFIKLGIQMAVDGSRPEVIEDILRTEMESVGGRHRDG